MSLPPLPPPLPFRSHDQGVPNGLPQRSSWDGGALACVWRATTGGKASQGAWHVGASKSSPPQTREPSGTEHSPTTRDCLGEGGERRGGDCPREKGARPAQGLTGSGAQPRMLLTWSLSLSCSPPSHTHPCLPASLPPCLPCLASSPSLRACWCCCWRRRRWAPRLRWSRAPPPLRACPLPPPSSPPPPPPPSHAGRQRRHVLRGPRPCPQKAHLFVQPLPRLGVLQIKIPGPPPVLAVHQHRRHERSDLRA